MSLSMNSGTELELARLAAIVSSSNDAIVSKDLKGTVTSWNAAAVRIFGHEAEEMIGRSILTIIPADLRAEEDDIIGRIRRGERIDHFDTVRVRKDGSRVDVSLTVSPLRNTQGHIIGASKIARDITERKRSEELKTILVNELNHRTKNLLTTVQTIAVKTFASQPGCEEALKNFNERVRALTLSQNLLTQNGWRGASLRTMIEAVLAPFAADGRVQISGVDDPHLSLRQLNALSLAIHELATNALKYGALKTAQGQVKLEYTSTAGALRLDWVESGGPRVSPPGRKGFGTQMIERALRHELGAEVELRYAESGLRCTIEFHL